MRFAFSLRAVSIFGGIVLVTCHPTGFEALGASYRSPHFDYLFHPDDPTVCKDVMDSLEQREQVLANYLQIDESTLPRVTYWKVRDENEYQAVDTAGESAGANAYSDFVVSPLPFDEHELTHTITLGAWGADIPRFLEEGIAVAMSCDPSASEVTIQPYNGWLYLADQIEYESNPPIVALVQNDLVPTIAQLWDVDGTGYRGYGAAGAVTTYLLDLAPVDHFRTLWASVHQSTSESDFSATMKSIYGVSLEDVWQTLLTTRHRPCAPVWMCSLAPITNNEHGVLRSSCTGKDLGRPTNGNMRLQYPAYSAGVYTMLTAPGGTFVPVVSGISLIPCDGDPANYLPPDPELQHRDLKADTWIPPLATPHVMTIETYAWVMQSLQFTYNTPDGQIAYTTSPLQPATPRCSDAVANTIPVATTSALYMPNDSQTYFAHFALQGLANASGPPLLDVDLYAYEPNWYPPAGVNVRLCEGCDGDDATHCDGCPFPSTDCIVKFSNETPNPVWLRVLNQGAAGEGYESEYYADPDAGALDTESGDATADGDAGVGDE